MPRKAPGVFDLAGAWKEQTRTAKSGKVSTRFTVEYDATPLEVDLSDKVVKQNMKAVAASIAESVQIEIGRISQMASPATIAKREWARRGSAKGTKTYWRRYAGGRIGEMEPQVSDRLFNDSGRLARLVVGFRKTSQGRFVATMNFPANRISNKYGEFPSFRLAEMRDRLMRLVPALRGEFRQDSQRRVVEATNTALDTIVTVSAAQKRANLIKVARDLMRIAKHLGL